MSAGKNPEDVPPARKNLVQRTCDLPGCERTYTAHAEAPLTWCSNDHGQRDPRGRVEVHPAPRREE